MKNKLNEKIGIITAEETERTTKIVNWLTEITNIVKPVSASVWNSTIDFSDPESGSVTITDAVYFRYNDDNSEERVGFHFVPTDISGNFCGIHADKLKGIELYQLLDAVINWIPEFVKEIDEKNNIRKELMKKINI
jgi:hypothetical protein